MYDANETAEKLGISIWTLKSWYMWENKRLKNGEIKKRYLPQPKRIENKKGRPRIWDEKMIERLKKYKDKIIIGRNGVYGEYTNPLHKETKKYKKQQEAKNE